MEYLLVKCWKVSHWNWEQSKDVCITTSIEHCTTGPSPCKKTGMKRRYKDWVGTKTVMIHRLHDYACR